MSPAKKNIFQVLVALIYRILFLNVVWKRSILFRISQPQAVILAVYSLKDIVCVVFNKGIGNLKYLSSNYQFM
jgi:hypothetical protein